MFEGISPKNFEQKCLCVLVLDVSSSMAGEPMNGLNKALRAFQKNILDDFVATQRIETCIVTFDSSAKCILEPSLIEDIQMPTLTTGGTTKLVEGVNMAINLVEQRKNWYKETGQNYFRPLIFLITDGEPDRDQDIVGLSRKITQGLDLKKFMFYSIGVGEYNHQKLKQICSNPEPLPLEGFKFEELFIWLSNSLSIITHSSEGQTLKLPPVDPWKQITM